MFTKSKAFPVISTDTDPALYHKLGANFQRGDARRMMSRSELFKFGQGAAFGRKEPRNFPLGEVDARIVFGEGGFRKGGIFVENAALLAFEDLVGWMFVGFSARVCSERRSPTE